MAGYVGTARKRAGYDPATALAGEGGGSVGGGVQMAEGGVGAAWG